MNAATGGPTLLRPDQAHHASLGASYSQGLPRDLARQATTRLRVLALLYAAIFFLADFVPSLITAHGRSMLTNSVAEWLPGSASIAVALLVAAVVTNPRLSSRSAAAIAIAFEIISSYGIAAAEFLLPETLDFLWNDLWIGLSWVSVWTLLFTIVVPSSPRRSLLVALAASSAVPATVAVSLTVFPSAVQPTALQFFFAFVFPYLLVVAMSYVGARVLFALGNEVRRARELGSYQLVERLGQGGMGEVWRARHRLLARPAAVKLIRPAERSEVGSEAIARFEREAQAIASLRSPHTVELFDFGIADDGTFYYVMELLDGLDGERLVEQYGPLSAGRVVHLIRQVCHSLSEAESISLAHRDIKPANIFLCRYGEDYDFVKVLDFGIVKAIHERSADDGATVDTALTAAHMVRGTPAFMAPEQVIGGRPVDHRVDIYGIGCVAYWLLTGQLVFTGDTPMKLLVQHAQTMPAPPSARTELTIPKELDAIVLACLAKDPADRPQTARELARRLAEVRIHDEWTPELARAWWKTHRPEVPSTSPDGFRKSSLG